MNSNSECLQMLFMVQFRVAEYFQLAGTSIGPLVLPPFFFFFALIYSCVNSQFTCFFIIFERVLGPHLSWSHIGRWWLQWRGAAFWPAHHHCGQTQLNSRAAGPPSPWVGICKSAQPTWPPRSPFPKRPAKNRDRTCSVTSPRMTWCP